MEAQLFEDEKMYDTSLLNYQLFVARSLRNDDIRPNVPLQRESLEDPENASIDRELQQLSLHYEQAKINSLEGLSTLEDRISSKGDFLEPDSVNILRHKNDKEKEYLQRTIILMELKQLAESITMISHKKKLKPGNIHKFKNRPLLWEERISRIKEE